MTSGCFIQIFTKKKKTPDPVLAVTATRRWSALLQLRPGPGTWNARPVIEIFPDNPSNRKACWNLIANGFSSVDGSPALTGAYGRCWKFTVQNDVRPISPMSKLYRMVRDCSECRQAPGRR